MNKFSVFSDSACDLPVDLVHRLNIKIIPFKVSFDKTNKLVEGVDITNDEFYRKLVESDVMPKTYPPTVKDYVDSFKVCLEQGRDVLCLCLSSKLSKSFNTALNAKKILSHTYKNNKIMVVDTLMASGGQGMLVMDAVKLSETTDVITAFNKLEEIKKDALLVITVVSLEQLAKGGRVSQTAAIFGTLLHINPIIYVSEGALESKAKAFGRTKALDMLKRFTLLKVGSRAENYDFCVLHARARGEAEILANILKSEGGLVQTIPPLELGATIGMHTGTSLVATCVLKKL